MVLAALLLGMTPQPDRGGMLEQAFTWARSIWEGAVSGPTAPSPEIRPTADPDQGAHIDPNG
jgi:hypothetical protein